MQDILSALNQYNSLQSSGAMDSLEKLKQENKELTRIIDDTFQLVSYTDINSMLNFMISKLIDYFIPDKMVFLIQPPRKTKIKQFIYRQLVKQDVAIDISYYPRLQEYFEEKHKTGLIKDSYEVKEIIDELGTGIFDNEFINANPKYMIPLFGIGGMYGLVLLTGKITGEKYTSSEMNYMTKMCSVLSITIQNGLHYETSITDPKTGLFTHDFFIMRMTEAIATLHRYKTKFGVLILDIDFFKKFNDTYGHLTGDKVLVALAKKLQETLRAEDCISRFGGEEFSVLIAQCDEKSIWIVAERIRKAISEIVLIEKGERLSITVSVGACLADDIKYLTPAYLVKKADLALYNSKETGRNRSTLYRLGLLDKVILEKEAAEKKH